MIKIRNSAILYKFRILPEHLLNLFMQFLTFPSCFCLFYAHSAHIVCKSFKGQTMVLILDGNSEIGAHVSSNFCYFNIENSHKSYFYLFSKKTYFRSFVRNMFHVTIQFTFLQYYILQFYFFRNAWAKRSMWSNLRKSVL